MDPRHFQASADFTLGVELELQIVHPAGHDLNPACKALRAALPAEGLPGRVSAEITESMVELCTGVCANHAEVLAHLQAMRDALVAAADGLGLALAGGGTHPFQRWTDRRIADEPRFRELSQLYGYLCKQFTVFGQHVHVGVAQPDDALQLLHGLSRHVPHLIALAASSPYVQGTDTAFDSARLNTVAAFPLAGQAPFITRWDAFCDHVERMRTTGVVHSMKDFYWDIRPKPEYGTVEVRVMDTPLDVAKAAALAGLVQCLAHWLLTERPHPLSADDNLPYAVNRFQACRFGLQAVYIEPGTHAHHWLRDEINTLLATLRPHAQALQADAALELLQAEVASEGNDAAWLRRRHAELESLPALVAAQAQRWRH